MITFFIPGNPVGKPRPRAAVGKTRAHVYDANTDLEWRARIRVEAKKYIDQLNHKGEPLRIDIEFFFLRPKSHYTRVNLNYRLKPNAPIAHIVKPDRDNLDKPVLDEFVKVGLINKDECVCDGIIKKHWTFEEPGAWVTIDLFEEDRLYIDRYIYKWLPQTES